MSITTQLRSLALLTTAVMLLSPAAQAGKIDLSWERVPGASGYRIYYGEVSGEYTASVDAGPVTEGTLVGLGDCRTWYVAVKAYNAAGESTQFSNEIVGWPRPAMANDGSAVFQQGDQLVLELDGNNFHPDAELVFNMRDSDGKPLVRVESMDVVSCHQIQALITVEPGARGFRAMKVGRHLLWVLNPRDGVGGKFFEVEFDEQRVDINRASRDTTDRVDAMDLVWLAHSHGAADGEGRFNPDADLNGDGFVDGEDLAQMASRFGSCWDGAAWSAAACN